MTNAEWLQLLQDLEDLEVGLKYVDLSSFEKTLRTARELLVEYRKQSEKRPKGEWLKSDIPESTLAKCSLCGFNCGAYTHNFCPNCGADMRVMKNE